MAPKDARKKLEQIRRNKNKNKSATSTKAGNVRDLRQLISKKKTKRDDRSPNKVASGRISKSRSAVNGGSRDLREMNKKLALRKNLTQSRDNRFTNKTDRQSTSRPTTNSNNKKPIIPGGKFKTAKQIQYYIPPHMQNQQPTYIIAPAAPQQSNLAMDNVPGAQGASILISNLIPSITQSEIIELFGEIGVMTAVNMINQTTALVTYQNSSDAVQAVKIYHNRLLDGKPMLVNMMPNSTPSSNVRSRIGHQPVQMDITYSGGRRI